MTKVITSPDIDFGVVDEFKSSVVNSKITNTGTERVTLTNLVSSDERFVLNSFDTRIEPKMPANSTLYFGANGRIQSATGAYYTTNQGFGSIGTTDSDGKLTVNYLMPSLALTAPSAGTKYKLSESFNVTWTSSNITLVNIILESESGGYKIFEDVDASLGTLAVSILASDGFSVNETVYIYIENTHQSIDDSVQVQSIATLTINTPTLTAGTEGNVTGTSNGVEVDVYYRVSSPEGAWEIFEEGVAVSGGNWSATGTIADADTYDFIAEDTTDRDGSAQVDDVVVESGQVIPTTNIYDSWSDDNITAKSGDMFQHRGNADVLIVLQQLSGLWTRHFNTASKTASTYHSNIATGWNYLNADSIDANDAHHLSGLNYTEVTRNRYTANNNSAGVSNNADVKVGIININGVMHVLLSNGKLYSANSNYSVLTEVGTLPVGANTTRKSMAYDSEYNILFVLEDSTVRVINLTTLALITSLSVGTKTGICHHKGRLHACNQVANRTTITIYKNDNDA